MQWMRNWARGCLAVAVAVWLASPCRVHAVYLDDAQNISLRARIYSQAAIRTNDSQLDTVPSAKRGQLVQHRNFYNPELDAKLTDYVSFLKGGPLDFLAPDELAVRIAGWGFYDGVFDYGAKQFGKSARRVNSTYPNAAAKPRSAFILEGADFRPDRKGGTIDEIFPGHDELNVRDIYGHYQRLNEAYINYTKGPLFLRIGRQIISWGEADTIALLDQNNPFDQTAGPPGIFQDIDESRIPLWTVRASYTLFEQLGPFSSGFLEAYWVPGDLDTNTGYLPILTAGPYSPRGRDPQASIPDLSFFPAQFVLLDRLPKKGFENSRYGFRFQTVIGQDHTLSVFAYTTFPSIPVPLGGGVVESDAPTSPKTNYFVTQTVHELTTAYAITDTFFFEPLDGIVRAEVEFFNREPGFVPEINLGIKDGESPINTLRGCGVNGKNNKCKLARANIWRWELGFDRFFFFRPLNPTNSFTLATAVVGAYNMDETPHQDFRLAGQRKPGTNGQDPDDFVQAKMVEAFSQIHLETDYMHGRIHPAFTGIFNVRGTYALLPAVTYRWNDSLLFDLRYVHIGGEYQQIGFFRDRDQVALRATYQLN